MTDTARREYAIRVENLGKRYQLGAAKSGSFRESMSSLFRSRSRAESDPIPYPRRPNTPSHPESNPTPKDFWALQDINFEIKRGEAVGIIGRNGAGKSTLLKILSRITEPTRGRFEIFGRVSSLLEVGTGFHPELTGRENVYLNGTILGMKRREVRAKFDEIVAFSGVEKFIDTPVKHYSSGMQVRLAFAVAAHLEPEILIIDEVLAVGDSVFQAKCIDKMTEVAQSGRTILFVSHNMQAVKQLCTRAILINNGKLKEQGQVRKVIDHYLLIEALEGDTVNLEYVPRKRHAGELLFRQVKFESNPVKFGEPISISIQLSLIKNTCYKDLDFGIALKDKNGNTVIHVSNRFISAYTDHDDDATSYSFSIENMLKPGIYYVTLFLRAADTIQDWLSDVIKLEVLDGNPYNFKDTVQIQGAILPNFSVNVQQAVVL